jgi:hypothetical protein
MVRERFFLVNLCLLLIIFLLIKRFEQIYRVMSMGYQYSDFINKPKEFFICQDGEFLTVEKKGLGIKKWIYTLLGSKRYDLESISKKIETALNDHFSSKFTHLTPTQKQEFVQKLNLKISSHNDRAEKVCSLFKRNHINEIVLPAPLMSSKDESGANISPEPQRKQIRPDMSRAEFIELLPSLLRRKEVAGDYKLSPREANLMLLVKTQGWGERQKFIDDATEEAIPKELVNKFLEGLKPDEKRELVELLDRIRQHELDKQDKDIGTSDMEKID